MGGLQKPISQLRCSNPKHASHRAVTFSRHHTSKLLGRYKSSKKNINDEISKKQVKNGPKMRVLMGDIAETGSPQAIKKGSDINDMKSCSCMLLSSDCCHFGYVFIQLSLMLFTKKLIKPLIYELFIR